MQGAGSRNNVKHVERKERSVNRNEDDADGRARMRRNEERVLRTQMRLYRHEGSEAVRTLSRNQRSLY